MNAPAELCSGDFIHGSNVPRPLFPFCVSWNHVPVETALLARWPCKSRLQPGGCGLAAGMACGPCWSGQVRNSLFHGCPDARWKRKARFPRNRRRHAWPAQAPHPAAPPAPSRDAAPPSSRARPEPRPRSPPAPPRAGQEVPSPFRTAAPGAAMARGDLSAGRSGRRASGRHCACAGERAPPLPLGCALRPLRRARREGGGDCRCGRGFLGPLGVRKPFSAGRTRCGSHLSPRLSEG